MPLLECCWSQGGFDPSLSLEYTTILSSWPFPLPPSLHFPFSSSLSFCFPALLLPVPLSALPLRPSSFHFPFSVLVSFPNLHITTVGHSLPNRMVSRHTEFVFCCGRRGTRLVGTGDGQGMCNTPEGVIVNYAHLDVLNPFAAQSNFPCHYISSLA